MKILFVIHQLDYADHIAIAYLSAVAKELKHRTFFCNLDKDNFGGIITAVKPDIVAYSANILGFKAIVAANKEARKACEFISIMGGPHPTFSPETFPESGMDAYCVGEGEYAFRDFLVKVEASCLFDEIPNLITKNKANPVRALIKDLDELPAADRDLVLSNSFLKNTPKKTFYATRGCPFQCAYCCNSYYHKLYRDKGPIVRRFSVERVIAEMEEVKSKYRMDFVKLGDDLFAMKADAWLEEFSEKYAERVGIPFNCYLRVDSVSDDLLKLLKRAGCYSVHLSVDSTSGYVREKVLQRNMLKADATENLKKIRSYGIYTWVNYMLAVPGSTLEDDLDTIKVSRKADITYLSYSTTVPTKGTVLYDYCLNRGYLGRGYAGDLTGCSEKSALSCFTEKEKNIRYNIYLLGALVAKLPGPLYIIAFFMMKAIPPNRFFKYMRGIIYRYYIENKIFLLPKG